MVGVTLLSSQPLGRGVLDQELGCSAANQKLVALSGYPGGAPSAARCMTHGRGHPQGQEPSWAIC